MKNASQVGVRRLEGYAEKQFMISLESRIKTDVTCVFLLLSFFQFRGFFYLAVALLVTIFFVGHA